MKINLMICLALAASLLGCGKSVNVDNLPTVDVPIILTHQPPISAPASASDTLPTATPTSTPTGLPESCAASQMTHWYFSQGALIEVSACVRLR